MIREALGKQHPAWLRCCLIWCKVSLRQRTNILYCDLCSQMPYILEFASNSSNLRFNDFDGLHFYSLILPMSLSMRNTLFPSTCSRLYLEKKRKCGQKRCGPLPMNNSRNQWAVHYVLFFAAIWSTMFTKVALSAWVLEGKLHEAEL